MPFAADYLLARAITLDGKPKGLGECGTLTRTMNTGAWMKSRDASRCGGERHEAILDLNGNQCSAVNALALSVCPHYHPEHTSDLRRRRHLRFLFSVYCGIKLNLYMR